MSTTVLLFAQSSRSGLIVQNQSAEETNTILTALADTSRAAYPNTRVMFYPRMVGYDNATVRAQWEEQYIGFVGGMWGEGETATFGEWAVAALGTNASGTAHTTKLGYFTTETEGWVGRPAGVWAEQEWHAWGAALFPHPSQSGKVLVIYDSNVENVMSTWAKGFPDRYGDLEPKQRGLLNFLRNNRGLSIREVWYGGKGNTAAGLCMPLTYDWCKQVLDGQGMPGGLGHDSLRAAGFWLLRNVPSGRGSQTPERKRYVRKDEGGDGRGESKTSDRRQSQRLRGGGSGAAA